ncbi:MAG: iron-containing redox enzyme family protein [Actinomycetota bacterium]|nr:iron-containing redox enzyme family protein [Actinomycetota bacterium]
MSPSTLLSPSSVRRSRSCRSSIDVTTPLHVRLDLAMTVDDADVWADVHATQAVDERDELVTLMDITDLWMAPVPSLAGRERFQFHPTVIALKRDLESRYMNRVRAGVDGDGLALADEIGAVAAMRRVGAAELVPEVYRWLADEATWEQIVDFLAHEGGPDAGFDDLVALAQVGIHDGPKVTLGANYWDEMGRGELTQVHTVLHDDLVAASGMPRLPRAELPVEALHRMALGGILATNRSLQPELLGALGLLEMQAGPRCRAVITALRRVDAPEGALPFYAEHAEADPRHGKEWLDHVVAPLAEQYPDWGARMVDGARWRHQANHRFFETIRGIVERRSERTSDDGAHA